MDCKDKALELLSCYGEPEKEELQPTTRAITAANVYAILGLTLSIEEGLAEIKIVLEESLKEIKEAIEGIGAP